MNLLPVLFLIVLCESQVYPAATTAKTQLEPRPITLSGDPRTIERGNSLQFRDRHLRRSWDRSMFQTTEDMISGSGPTGTTGEMTEVPPLPQFPAHARPDHLDQQDPYLFLRMDEYAETMRVNDPTRKTDEDWARMGEMIDGMLNRPVHHPRQLPSVAGQDVPEQKSRIECSICLEQLGRQRVSRMNCQHYFHTACINQWLQVNDKCPRCRQ